MYGSRLECPPSYLQKFSLERTGHDKNQAHLTDLCEWRAVSYMCPRSVTAKGAVHPKLHTLQNVEFIGDFYVSVVFL